MMREENHQNSKILVVDDDPAIGVAVQLILQSLTENIVITQSGKEAIEACRKRSFDLIISDMRMPEMDGIELLQLMAHDYPSMRRVILTGYGDLDDTRNAINLGRVHRYLTKPFTMEVMVNAISDELTIGERERSEIVRLREIINKLTS